MLWNRLKSVNFLNFTKPLYIYILGLSYCCKIACINHSHLSGSCVYIYIVRMEQEVMTFNQKQGIRLDLADPASKGVRITGILGVACIT